MSPEDPRPGTVGSLDRRVERLEAEFADLRSDFRLMQAEQCHARELMEQHFKTIEGSVQLALAETKLISQKFDAALLQGITASADASSTVAGRSILERISTIEHDKETEHAEFSERDKAIETRLTGIERRFYVALGVTLLAVLLIPLIVPLVSLLLQRLP